MASNSIQQYFEKAISSEENQQLEFVRQIPEILTTFQQSWIFSKFLPFFVSWLPKNNEKIILAVIQYIPQFVTALGSILSVEPLIEAVLLSDNPEIVKQLIPILTQFENDPTCYKFIKLLSKSQYDCVRSFVLLILNLAHEEGKRKLLKKLVYDFSFRVRQASLQVIESTSNEELACKIVISIADDSHTRIRAFIPIVSSHRPFYVAHILPKIQNDLDWSVRASIARELVKCPDVESAIKSCFSFVSDKVWQVRLFAIKSLISLLPRSKTISIDQEFLNLLMDTFKFPQPSLKKSVVDFILATGAKPSNFADIMMSQDPETKIYFVAKAIRRNKIKLLLTIPKNQIFEIIKDITKSEKWKIRKAAIDIFIDIANIIQDQRVVNQLNDICLSLLNDEAAPVRESAAMQITSFMPIDNIEQNFPQFLNELEESDYFRQRQTAIDVLYALITKTSSQSTKELLISHIQNFKNDSVSNVVEYANYILNQIESKKLAFLK